MNITYRYTYIKSSDIEFLLDVLLEKFTVHLTAIKCSLLQYKLITFHWFSAELSSPHYSLYTLPQYV